MAATLASDNNLFGTAIIPLPITPRRECVQFIRSVHKHRINEDSKYFDIVGSAGHILYGEGGKSVTENYLASSDFTPRTPHLWTLACA